MQIIRLISINLRCFQTRKGHIHSKAVLSNFPFVFSSTRKNRRMFRWFTYFYESVVSRWSYFYVLEYDCIQSVSLSHLFSALWRRILWKTRFRTEFIILTWLFETIEYQDDNFKLFPLIKFLDMELWSRDVPDSRCFSHYLVSGPISGTVFVFLISKYCYYCILILYFKESTTS